MNKASLVQDRRRTREQQRVRSADQQYLIAKPDGQFPTRRS
ncbi:hypothetical protein [Streptomyces sp. NPDC048361]